MKFGIPWTQLTRLLINTDFTVAERCDVFLRAPNLVECRLGLYDENFNYLSRPIIRHAHLRTLDLTFRCDPGPLLDCLSLPALRCFGFKDVSGFLG